MPRSKKKATRAVIDESPYTVDVGQYMPDSEDRPSWIQFTSSRLATGLLAFLCVLSIFFVGIWAFTLPSLADLRIPNTQEVDWDEAFEQFYAARRSHFNDIRDMYLLVMGTTLAPALSLLFGHAFGRAQERRRASESK